MADPFFECRHCGAIVSWKFLNGFTRLRDGAWTDADGQRACRPVSRLGGHDGQEVFYRDMFEELRQMAEDF